ncbi:hypothetical protein C2845_PM12G16200 [Panicum miliaceum]|uniref:F-box associated domain-containing protein n=1 Tax=Panicum miliaceum TaxID=4540 RepID=A0A3L6QLG9_PANMI|nr:hypothetical protein C2845_PM12G16200 [Panicum miliaceum]
MAPAAHLGCRSGGGRAVWCLGRVELSSGAGFFRFQKTRAGGIEVRKGACPFFSGRKRSKETVQGWRALISDPAFAAAHRSRAAAAPVVVGVFKKTSPLPPGSPHPSPYELRVIDTASGDVLRVVKDIRRPDLVRTRLDLVFIAQGDLGACWIATTGNGVAVELPTWRQRPNPLSLPAAVNGRRRTPNDHGRRCPGYPRIASFDLGSEEWRKTVIGAPRTGWSDEVSGCHMRLAELKGTLSVLQTVGAGYDNSDDRDTNIWLLVDPKKSIWVKGHTIRTPKSWGWFRALDIFVDGRILMLNYYLTTTSGKDDQDLCGAHLQFYNTSTGALTDLMEMGQGFIGSSLTLYTRNLLA